MTPQPSVSLALGAGKPQLTALCDVASASDPWHPLPLLASTQFCTQLLLRGPVLDLRSICEVLLFDPCAVLRVFGAADQASDGAGPPARIGECIIALGREGLHQALLPPPSTWAQQKRLSAVSEHGVVIGRAAESVAAALGLCEETAYLLGLLHALGELPAVVCSAAPCGPEEDLFPALLNTFALPETLHAALLSLDGEPGPSLWTAVLQAAHDLTEAAPLS